MVRTGESLRQPHVVRRLAEEHALAEVVHEVAEGRSSTVVLRGIAGQGKTTLIEWLAAAARGQGFAVLRTTGVEFESGVAYSGLSAVLRPVLGRVGDLPPVLATALMGALGLGPDDATALPTYSATLALLSLVAEQAPTIVLVDDAHWVDYSSLEALLFAAHRCDADRVGFVFAVRSGAPCLVDQTRFQMIELGGLDVGAVVELLADLDVAPSVARRCWERTDGNPMALIEAARGLSSAQRAGQVPLPGVLPVAEALVETFRSRVRKLPEPTVAALRVAALEPDDDLAVIAEALDRLGGTVDHLEPAERDGVVTVGDGLVRWRHPLLRGAVSADMTSSDRRRVHGALAQVLTALHRDDRAVWHLSESVAGPNDGVAGQLVAAATAARRRGAFDLAADALAHAARLASDPADRADHVLAAADARWAYGNYHGTAATLAPLLDHADDPVVRARAVLLQGQADRWLTGLPQSIVRLEASAATVSDQAPALAAVLLLHAAMSRMMALDVAGACASGQQAARAAERGDDPTIMFAAYAVRSLARFFSDDPWDGAQAIEPIAQVVAGNLDKVDEGLASIALICAYAQMSRGDTDEAIDLLRLIVDYADSTGELGGSLPARVMLGMALWRLGRWSESLAEVSHLWSIHVATGQVEAIACASAILAHVEAGLGQAETCRRHVADALATTTRLGLNQLSLIALDAIGLLELGTGRWPEAAAAFDQIAAQDRVSEPGWLWWQADAVEAYVACGRRDSAAAVLARLEGQAQATGRVWARAAADRCAGLLEPGERADRSFSAAIGGFRALRAPFEEARTLLLRGRRRLESGDRAAGSRDAVAARTIFDRLGARDWSGQASSLRGELSAESQSLAARLTPAELRVALAVGAGATNREAADRLYISVKTVDHHLQSIYRKLGLRRRSQLATVVAAEGSLQAMSAPAT
jgi:DNA-binding CsgD family transcriptional regulator